MKIFAKSDEAYLKKIAANTLLDLALILPKSFENTFLTDQPKECLGVVEVEIKSSSKRQNTYIINAFCITWQMSINLIIFHPKSYHFAVFKSQQTMFVLGTIQHFSSSWQIVQPKIITTINTITPHYKSVLKNTTHLRLVKTYITKENLSLFNLNPTQINTLLLLHKADILSIEAYKEENFIEHKKILKEIEIYNYLLKLSYKKLDFEASSVLNGDESEFIKSLPFKLTNDQKNAIFDIKKDLLSTTAAKRVIMGDVGCGKTIVIFASVLMAYPKRSILLVPTTILAEQIYLEAQKLLPKHINFCLITGKEKDDDLQKYDFIIGTHALLYKSLPFCDLVMIDEQHRFGTNQRQALQVLVSKDDKKAHFLQFTATPIPRTLALINSSVVNYSFIKQMPFEKDITTTIIKKEDFSKLLTHIDSEIAKNNQIIIIYPLIESSEAISYQSLEQGRGFWEKKYKNVFVTHGKDKQKEQILQDFKANGDILLSTTVVEVGISLPRLSTIIIVGAERLGFASLHQLRGRVSRNGLKGYCFLFTNSSNSQRLADFAKTKNGFEIAQIDLMYRQGGDILNGIIQHGVSFKYFDIKTDEDLFERVKSEFLKEKM